MKGEWASHAELDDPAIDADGVVRDLDGEGSTGPVLYSPAPEDAPALIGVFRGDAEKGFEGFASSIGP